MTIAQIHTAFSLIADKYGSDAALEPTEIDNYLNQAQILLVRSYINNQYGKDDPNYNIQPIHKQQAMAIEDSVISALNLSVLHSNVSLSSTSLGVIQLSDIEATFPADTVQGGQPAIEYIQKSATRDGEFARWRSNNDIARQQQNSFKVATAEKPRWTFVGNTIVGLPTGVATWTFDVWRTPLWCSLSDGVDLEFTGDTVNTIIFRGLQLAGISIRDADFWQIMNQEQVKQ
jgi:hypothetical protein